MEDHCGNYYDGFLAGFMCCRKPHTTGRHMWFLKENPRNCFYWTEKTNAWYKRIKKGN